MSLLGCTRENLLLLFGFFFQALCKDSSCLPSYLYCGHHHVLSLRWRSKLAVPSASLSPGGNLQQRASSPGFKLPLEGSLNSLALSFPIAVPAFLSSSFCDWLCHRGPNTLDSVLLDGAPRADHPWQSQLQRPSVGENCFRTGGKEKPSSAGDTKDAGWARPKARELSHQFLSFLSAHSPYSTSASINHTHFLCPHTYETKRRYGVFFVYQIDI